MSETVTVRRREFGFSLMDDCGSTAYVPDDDAPAVALALLGDRDALIERAARAYFNAYWDADHYHPTPYSAQSELDKEQYRTVARAMLAAIGGGGGEGGDA